MNKNIFIELFLNNSINYIDVADNRIKKAYNELNIEPYSVFENYSNSCLFGTPREKSFSSMAFFNDDIEVDTT